MPLPIASHVLPCLLLASAALAACTVGPDYVRPSAPTPPAFKELQPPDAGWMPAAPADALDRGPWWQLFGDKGLDELMPQVEVSNQNVAAAVAAFAQARALVTVDRAALFPQLVADGSAKRSGGNAAGGTANSFQAGLAASWAPDIWGALRRTLEGARASAQASEADLAAARLSAQGELATDYFALRATDAQIALTQASVEGYERSLKITQDRYNAAIAAKTDVLQAQTLLDSTRANLSTLKITRAQLEHAIAVLIGKAPAELSLPVEPWNMTVPAIPVVVPSELLQRRPDIAASERAVAAANAQIGVQRAAYFPSISLTGSFGRSSGTLGDLFSAPSSLWSLGLSAAQAVFDAGTIGGRVASAEAGRDLATAQYRQLVLTAFQGVEDQLASLRYLQEQAELRRSASEAADLTEQQLLNRYKQGLVAYTDVVTAQVSALQARITLSQLASSRQAAAVALIQALGGGWHAPA